MKKPAPKTVSAIFGVVFFLGLACGLLGAVSANLVLTLCGTAVMVCAAVLRNVLYKCPHCGARLDKNARDTCPHCGKPLNG